MSSPCVVLWVVSMCSRCLSNVSLPKSSRGLPSPNKWLPPFHPLASVFPQLYTDLCLQGNKVILACHVFLISPMAPINIYWRCVIKIDQKGTSARPWANSSGLEVKQRMLSERRHSPVACWGLLFTFTDGDRLLIQKLKANPNPE